MTQARIRTTAPKKAAPKKAAPKKATAPAPRVQLKKPTGEPAEDTRIAAPKMASMPTGDALVFATSSVSAAIAACGMVVPGKSANPILGCCMISAAGNAVSISTTNVAASVQAKITAISGNYSHWSALVPVRQLAAALKTVSADRVGISVSASTLLVSTERSVVRLPTQPVQEFPSIAWGDDYDHCVTLPADIFKSAVARATSGASTESVTVDDSGIRITCVGGNLSMYCISNIAVTMTAYELPDDAGGNFDALLPYAFVSKMAARAASSVTIQVSGPVTCISSGNVLMRIVNATGSGYSPGTITKGMNAPNAGHRISMARIDAIRGLETVQCIQSRDGQFSMFLLSDDAHGRLITDSDDSDDSDDGDDGDSVLRFCAYGPSANGAHDIHCRHEFISNPSETFADDNDDLGNMADIPENTSDAGNRMYARAYTTWRSTVMHRYLLALDGYEFVTFSLFSRGRTMIVSPDYSRCSEQDALENEPLPAATGLRIAGATVSYVNFKNVVDDGGEEK
jgi:hypothetical protein